MRWEAGRQGTGYRKLLLARGRAWDLWLLDYPPGTAIPPHTDPAPPGRRHYRVNVVLKRGRGGHFGGETLVDLGRVKFFRPDVAPHSVSPVECRRVVLSFGWLV